MISPPTVRPHDVVLFGATGYTGALTAEYLVRHAPAECRIALAGRNRARLETLRERLAKIASERAELPLLIADSADREALRAVAASTRVVISTVGPYLRHGEPLVAACAEEGTDYCDLTGEPEFVDLMYLRHHERAVASGARIVHSCGFDSVPHDLGVLFTVGQLPPEAPKSVEGFVRAGGTVSGGTLDSALTALSRPLAMARTAARRRAVEPRPSGRRIRIVTGRPGWSRAAHAWVVPLPTIDPQVVARSAAALPSYGPEFRYAHYAAVKRLPVAVTGILGIAMVVAASQVAPLRRALTGIRSSGEGPSPQQRAKGWFAVRFTGEGGGKRVITEVSGGDPGYTETAKIIAETAMSLAFDELPRTAGQVTTAVAMGSALIDRLSAAGIRFTVLERPPSGPPGRSR
ncbi:saccharopine dehydrogenase NADP-binding domain-containing protein [Streptomyces sp. RB6PN25]|uniref:Saccharopine dehydrogenase NADP-binding domain-containing protein n=1 Tax=Streptomyces humicola TaxID=2953240 RepID=A0ABT1PXH6_9ACTN|nr:saccharopine dehydrogenase NADP-binding domain-containing protein [Streptomyces humicola]MCQ4082384.1 saccharopine dehydrogenase NADP-binding domain-containing protein [Streptomyces humicola]